MDEASPPSDPQPVGPTVPPPLHPPHPALAAALAFGLFVTLGAVTQLLNAAFGIWFTEIFIFLGVPWVMLRRSGYEPAGYTGLTPFLGRPRCSASCWAWPTSSPWWCPSSSPRSGGARSGCGTCSTLAASSRARARGAGPHARGRLGGRARCARSSSSEASSRRACWRSSLSPGARWSSPRWCSAPSTWIRWASSRGWSWGVLFGCAEAHTGSLWPGILGALGQQRGVLGAVPRGAADGATRRATDDVPRLARRALPGARGRGRGCGSLRPLAAVPRALGTAAGAAHPRHKPVPLFALRLLPWVVGATLVVGGLVAGGRARHPPEPLRHPAPGAQAAQGRVRRRSGGARQACCS